MGKRKSGGDAAPAGKAAKKVDLALPTVPAADVKAQEHLKMFDEWLFFGFNRIVIPFGIVQFLR